MQSGTPAGATFSTRLVVLRMIGFSAITDECMPDALKPVDIDKIIKTIRESKTSQAAKVSLMKGFGLSEMQAQAILEMQLQRLTGLERNKIEDEYKVLLKAIEEYRAILASDKRIDNIIKDELAEIKKKFGYRPSQIK